MPLLSSVALGADLQKERPWPPGGGLRPLLAGQSPGAGPGAPRWPSSQVHFNFCRLLLRATNPQQSSAHDSRRKPLCKPNKTQASREGGRKHHDSLLSTFAFQIFQISLNQHALIMTSNPVLLKNYLNLTKRI